MSRPLAVTVAAITLAVAYAVAAHFLLHGDVSEESLLTSVQRVAGSVSLPEGR